MCLDLIVTRDRTRLLRLLVFCLSDSKKEMIFFFPRPREKRQKKKRPQTARRKTGVQVQENDVEKFLVEVLVGVMRTQLYSCCGHQENSQESSSPLRGRASPATLATRGQRSSLLIISLPLSPPLPPPHFPSLFEKYIVYSAVGMGVRTKTSNPRGPQTLTLMSQSPFLLTLITLIQPPIPDTDRS